MSTQQQQVKQPAPVLSEKELEELKNLSPDERFEWAERAQAKCKDMLEAAKVEDENSPKGYSYDFAKCEGVDNAEEGLAAYKKEAAIVEEAEALNRDSHKLEILEGPTHKLLINPKSKDLGTAMVTGQCESIADYMTQFKGFPNWKKKKFDDYAKNEVFRFGNTNHLEMIQNLVTTGTPGGPSPAGKPGNPLAAPAGETRTQAITTFLPRSAASVQMQRKIQDSLVSRIPIQRLTSGDGYSWLVEDNTILAATNSPSKPARPGPGAADDIKMAKVREAEPYPEQDVKAGSDQIQVVKMGFISRFTREQADDVEQFSQFLDEALGKKALEFWDNNIINSDGTTAFANPAVLAGGPSMVGLRHQTGIGTKARVAGKDIFDFINEAKADYSSKRASISATNVVTYGAGVAPQMLVLNPIDVARMQRIKDGNQNYKWSNLVTGDVPRLWGMEIVESQFLPVGTALMLNLDNIFLLVKDNMEIEMGYTSGDWEADIKALKYSARANLVAKRKREIMQLSGLEL